MKIRIKLFVSAFLGSLCLVMVSCGGGGSSDDPCDGVTCSFHGTCVVEGGTARCDCAPGFEEEGLACVESASDGDADSDIDGDIDGDVDGDADGDLEEDADGDGDIEPECGDGECNGDEDACTCEEDCGAECGDGCCTYDESVDSCFEDCSTSCGDGSVDEGETCDDGNRSDRDGCSSACRVEGDVNGDGYADLVIGAWANGSSPYGSMMSKGFVVMGGPLMRSGELPSVATVTVDADEFGDGLGRRAVGLGDINNDGYWDVGFGAPSADAETVDVGRVFIFYGGAGFAGDFRADSADVILSGTSRSGLIGFGASLCGLGDIVGDSHRDIAVGDTEHSSGGLGPGAVYIFDGETLSTGTAATAAIEIVGDIAGAAFGSFVDITGDLDDDGHHDLVVGSYVPEGTGRVYVFLSTTGIVSGTASAADVILTSEGAGDYFALYGSVVGDVTGDEVDDLLVGAFRSSGESGRAYLFEGGPTLRSGSASIADVTFEGSSGQAFGYAPSCLGDLNGDEVLDFGINSRQGVSVFYGSDSFPSTVTMGAASLQITGSFVYRTASSLVGFVDDDDTLDIVVSDYGNRPNARGQAYVFYTGGGFGSTTTDAADVTITGENYSELGMFLGSLGF